MGTYDYDKLRELYGANDYQKDTSGFKTIDTPAKADIFDNDFSELDEIKTEVVSDNSDYIAKEELFAPSFHLEPITVDESIKEKAVVPNMEETLKIETLSLEDLSPKIMKAIDKKYDGISEEKKNPGLLTRLFPWTTAESHHLENAFVNCAVLGFITAGMGSGMLLYILNHI